LNCRNWECGVVLPIIVDRPDQAKSPADGQIPNFLNVFKDVVPVPMKVPGQAYQGDKKPWFSSEQ
jgi:Tyrosyl-DNA phosphodiesterase